MVYTVYSTAFYADIIKWLQENVGKLLWSRPIIEWQGVGWHVAYDSYTITRYKVTLEDEKLLLMFALRWA